MKIGLESFNSFQVAAIRISVAGVFLLPFIRWKKVKIKEGDLKYFAISGFLGNFLPAFLFTAAQTRISSSLTGALNSLTPLFALGVGVLFMGVKMNRNQVLGVIVGLIGALLLVFNQGFSVEASQPAYTFLIILATICYGINVNIIKNKLNDYPALLVASLPLGIVSIVGIAILFYTGLPFQFDSFEYNKAFSAVITLAVVGTALSLIMFNRLIQMTNAVFASSVTYLIPIVAMIWGSVDSEQINIYQVSGLILILIAIRIINFKRKKRKSVVVQNKA